MADSFPESYAVLFRVPENVDDDELKAAIGHLSETLKADLVTANAPVEVIMEASVCITQFAKHMQASRQPYGHPELGAYSDPGSERAALSSLHNGLTALREALFKLRAAKVNPAQVQAALAEHDQKFISCAQQLFQACKAKLDPVAGEDLMFFVQETLFPLLQEEGLAE